MPLPPFLTDPLVLAALALAIILALVALFMRGSRHWLKHVQRKPLLTPNEAEFFHRLQRALPGFHIFPQVSFGAILTDDGKLSNKSRWSVRGKFDRKIADFVVCERSSLKVVALVELDDSTHVARHDRQRDAITKAGGYQTIRFQSRRKPSQSEIASLFQHAQAWQ